MTALARLQHRLRCAIVGEPQAVDSTKWKVAVDIATTPPGAIVTISAFPAP